ncbi:SGNH/GDSL hydrolase family protein [Rhizobium panacihumi]|uniref:SGNH/GDSL hydrolase family protein n=1 Tax=Rhizobium panacihumi TaxID=2008450 RepID=UPI003D792A59
MRLALVFVIMFFAGSAIADPLCGRENMAAFYGALVQSRSDGRPVKIHIVGDSKAAGQGVSSEYTLQSLLTEASNGYPVQVTATGYSAQNSEYWLKVGVTEFLRSHADVDLLVVNFGTNEKVAALLQSDEDIAKNHTAALSIIRREKSANELSVLFLGQPPANNHLDEFKQTTETMRGVNAILKNGAKHTNSAYFDTLALFSRAHSEAGWMDNAPVPTIGSANIHPGAAMNMVLIGELARGLFPIPFKARN